MLNILDYFPLIKFSTLKYSTKHGLFQATLRTRMSIRRASIQNAPEKMLPVGHKALSESPTGIEIHAKIFTSN